MADSKLREIIILLAMFVMLAKSALRRLCSASVRAYRTGAIIILNTVLVLVFLEFFISTFEIYSANGVGEEENEELAAYRLNYRPYVMWRHLPYTGETVNIGLDGLRVTPGADCSEDSYKVFAFGGSAMWGVGVPDKSTIPSHLVNRLGDAIDSDICLENFGEYGFVSRQNLAALNNEIIRGNIPDLVIFLDGFNDVFTAWEWGRPGMHYKLHNFEGRLEGIGTQRYTDPFLDWIKGFNLASLASQILGDSENDEEPDRETFSDLGISADALSKNVAENYLSIYRTVTALSNEYSFEVYFFLQPVIWLGDKTLTDSELEVLEDANYWGSGDFSELLKASYREIGSRLGSVQILSHFWFGVGG